jgi:hypothetical protein
MADLNKVRAGVFSLYQQQRYEEALRVANEVADEFPASSTYWTACLLAVQDRQEQALDALMDALNKGAWWPSLMLQRDPDLDSIRQSPEFARIRTESERRWKLAFKAEPEILVHTPRTSPSGVLLMRCMAVPANPQKHLHVTGERLSNREPSSWFPNPASLTALKVAGRGPMKSEPIKT